MKTLIPLASPVLGGNEWKYVKECLDSGWVSSAGKHVTIFEDMVAAYSGAKYAVATVNGTSALHVTLMARQVGHGDEVIVPAVTFIAPVNAVMYCGARPVFMDCCHDTLCMDMDKLKAFLSKSTVMKKSGCYNRRSGRRIKAIIPVHIFGHPVDMDAVKGLCGLHKIDVVEDATESLGSEYKGRRTGALGLAGCFSFNGNKIITTGGGGMVVTDDKELAQRVRHLTTQAKADQLEYIHDDIGYNYRLTNIQAAMGIGQMEMLDKYVAIKRRNAAIYMEALSGVTGVELLWERDGVKSNFWLCAIRVPKRDKKPLIKYLLAGGIQARPVWKPINTLAMYRMCEAYKVKEAQNAYDTIVNLPSGVGLKEEDIASIAGRIRRYFDQ